MASRYLYESPAVKVRLQLYALETLSIPGLKTFRVRYSPSLVPSAASSVLSSINPGLAICLKEKYKNADKTNLWVSVRTHALSNRPHVYHSQAGKLIRAKLFGALREHGFDKNGKRLIFDEHQKIVRRETGLVGVLDILPLPERFDLYNRKLVKADSTLLVKGLVELLESDVYKDFVQMPEYNLLRQGDSGKQAKIRSKNKAWT